MENSGIECGGRREFALCVFSARRGGYGAAVDLLRAVLRLRNDESARVHNEKMDALLDSLGEDGEAPEDLLPDGWRKRIADYCDGYLVTECEPFSEGRAFHLQSVDASCISFCDVSPSSRFANVAGGGIDATEFIAAGGMISTPFGCVGQAVWRGGWKA